MPIYGHIVVMNPYDLIKQWSIHQDVYATTRFTSNNKINSLRPKAWPNLFPENLWINDTVFVFSRSPFCHPAAYPPNLIDGLHKTTISGSTRGILSQSCHFYGKKWLVKTQPQPYVPWHQGQYAGMESTWSGPIAILCHNFPGLPLLCVIHAGFSQGCRVSLCVEFPLGHVHSCWKLSLHDQVKIVDPVCSSQLVKSQFSAFF